MSREQPSTFLESLQSELTEHFVKELQRTAGVPISTFHKGCKAGHHFAVSVAQYPPAKNPGPWCSWCSAELIDGRWIHRQGKAFK